MTDDDKEARKAASLLNIDNFGPNDAFILNKDLTKDSFTYKEANEMLVMRLAYMLKFAPEVKHFGIFFFACHGMAF